MMKLLGKVITCGGAALALKSFVYDPFIAGSVPSRELVGFWPVQATDAGGATITVNRISISTHDVVFCLGLIGLGLGTVMTLTAKLPGAAPKGAAA